MPVRTSDRIRLTDAKARSLAAPERGRRRYYDEGVKGLALQVTAAGSRTWYVVRRRAKGRPEQVHIGPLSDFSVKQARAKATEHLAKLLDGESVQDQRRRERDLARTMNLGTAFEWYLGLPKRRGVGTTKSPKTIHDYRRLFENHLKPWARRSLDTITRREVRTLHQEITANGTPYVANRVLGLIKSIYGAAIEHEEYAGANPTDGVRRNHESVNVEEHLIPDEKLAAIFAAMDQEVKNPHAEQMLRIAILTGRRTGVIRAMRWGDLDLEAGLWVYDADAPLNKDKRRMRIKLSPGVIEILLRRRMLVTESDWVFPAIRARERRDGTTTEFIDRPKDFWSRVKKRAGITERCRMHDLRHTAASAFLESGMTVAQVARALGHQNTVTTSRYLHAKDDGFEERLARHDANTERLIGSAS
ncbi:MAG: site-specific integrase [Planctomycetota bacterium]